MSDVEQKLDALLFMAGINMALLVVGISIGITILIAGFNARGTLMEILRTIQLLLRECVKYLEMGKTYSQSAHINQQSAARVMEEVKQVAPTISQQIEEVPKKTAVEVVEAIKSGDNGTHS